MSTFLSVFWLTHVGTKEPQKKPTKVINKERPPLLELFRSLFYRLFVSIFWTTRVRTKENTRIPKTLEKETEKKRKKKKKEGN